MARYNGRMMHEAFELRGSDQYTDVAALESALSAARSQIEDDGEFGGRCVDWFPSQPAD